MIVFQLIGKAIFPEEYVIILATRAWQNIQPYHILTSAKTTKVWRTMNIIYVVCPAAIEEKLESKHSLTLYEARQALLNHTRIRFAEKGYIEGNDVYAAFGQTLGGRYIAVFFIYKPETATAIIISARDMNAKERRAYGRK